MKFVWAGLALILTMQTGFAQVWSRQGGFRMGVFRVWPELEGRAVYDDRVAIDNVDGSADDDFYFEYAAGFDLANSDARYDVYGRGMYGYRSYEEYTGLDDDFFDFGAGISSDKNPLKTGLSASHTKSLNYDTLVDFTSGREPGEILTDETSTRSSIRANAGYEGRISDKLSLEPGYEYWYYLQEFEGGSDTNADWQVHKAGLLLGYEYADKTQFFISSFYSLQKNDNEDGRVGGALLGARSRLTEKTRWVVQVGVAFADYDVSGSEQSLISNVRGTWQATDKVSAYVFGGNDFRPGSGNGEARLTYRLGYGTDWYVNSRWKVGGQVLHDADEKISETSADESLNFSHFVALRTSYDVAKYFRLTLSGRYIDDELDADQTIVSLNATVRY
jgi:hypothetical protein